MYEGFYGLKENPFRLTPDPTFICMTGQHQEALSGLIYNVCTRPGLMVLVGEAGTGKTTLLYSLMGLLEKQRFVTALCTNPTLTREEFYDHLMIQFGVECSSTLKSRQLVALEQVLRKNHDEGRPSVLIVDEAQRLSTELLEEIRLLLNLETTREKLVQIIIAGQPELLEILRRPDLRQLKQRVSALCKLKALTLEDMCEYIRHRITQAGLPAQSLFAARAMQVIFEYTQGIPRLVNSICDSALQTGFALRSAAITPEIAEEAARDLDMTKATAPAQEGVGELSSSKVPADIPIVPNSEPLPVREPELLTAQGVTRQNGNGTVHQNGKGTGDQNGNGNVAAAARIPLEDYASRPKNLSFFAGLMDRFR